MKLHRFFPAPLGLGLGLLAALAVSAQCQADDPYQRTIQFHNSLTTTIYPVIQSPQDRSVPPGGKPANCGTGGLLRIIVNKDETHNGIPPGETVTVSLPKDAPCPNGGFYDASRIFVLVADRVEFEKVLNDDQKTYLDPGWDYTKYPLCEGHGCKVGTATADYGHDAPGQLLEYTIVSQNPATGAAFANPNNTDGTPLIDFDVSYVDSAQQPVAMALGDGGATQFMGSTLNATTFAQRLTDFLTAANWSRFADFAPLNWATVDECVDKDGKPVSRPTNPNKTHFSCLVPRIDVVPSANILIANARLGGFSSFYAPTWDGVTPRNCNAAKIDPGANLKCSTPRPDGDGLDDENAMCCPTPAPGNVMLGCCDQVNFLIDNTHRRFQTAVKPMYFDVTNDTLNDIVTRFTAWQGPSRDPCADPSGPATAGAPVLASYKSAFCAAFKRTVDFVWQEFAPQCSGQTGELADECVVANIIGYTLKDSKYDPNLCLQCPNASPTICPRSCALEAQRNESVQALQRGLPWTASGDPAQCDDCPSEDATLCPSTCILPVEVSAKATLYHRDKFLHFWPSYASPYALNPYARFVHNDADGLAAPGAYSFSIDDFYGNFGGMASSMLIDVGGTDSLVNKEPFDPFKQYHANMGTGWHHATVCGRTYRLPAKAPANVGLSAPVSFWGSNGYSPSCEVRLFATADETKYISFMLSEVTYQVTDGYTGRSYSVKGLGGVFPVRFPTDQPPNDSWCTTKSTDKALVGNAAKAICKANLSAGKLNLDYVSVSDSGCVGQPPNATCGKPLVNLNTPSLTSVGRGAGKANAGTARNK